MTTSVVEQVRAQSTGSTVTFALAATPAAGDHVYVTVVSQRSTPRTISSVAGCGATWTEVSNLDTSRVVTYRGTGANASGTVTVTLSGTQTSGGGLWLVRGATTTVSASYTNTAFSAGTVTAAGPSNTVGLGQAAMVMALGSANPITFPVNTTPSGGWTTPTNGTLTGIGYAVPGSSATHQLSLTQTGGGVNIYIAQVLAGDASSGTTVNGTQVTETDSGQTGSTLVGAVVAGGQSTTTNTAQAGTATVGARVTGSLASETDTGQAGTSTANAVVAGAQSVESDTAQAGTLVGAALIAGTRATETDTAQAGSIATGLIVPGTQSVETDTAQSGALIVGAVVSGGRADETDTVLAGGAGFVVAGSLATETDTAQAGSAVVGGSDALDLSTFVNLYSSSTWDGTTLTGGYFTFPLVVDPAETYTVEIDYTVTTGTGYVSVHSALGPSDELLDASSFATLDDEGSLTGSGTSTLTIGPSLGGWDAAMALDEVWPAFFVTNVEITAIRVTPSFLPGVYTPPAPPGTALDRSGGRSRTGVAVVSWTPAVVPPPTVMVSGAHRRIRAAAYGAVTMVGTQPTFTVSSATAARTRTRILVGGKDISFFRGVPTPEPGYQLAEPLLWGPTSIELPQVSACFETPGDGELAWCAKGKPVKFERVTDGGTIVAVDYRGIVVAHDVSGRNLRLEVGGHGQGRASLRYKPSPIFRDVLDLGRLAWAAIRDMGLQFEPRLGPTTGMKSALIGGMTHLDYIAELCAKAWKRNGTQWTLMPDDDATYTFAPKDTETVHFTVFTDDAHSVPDLRSDAAEEPNRIFATGVTPKGQRVRFGVYPGLIPGPAAPYPFDDDSSFDVGTTDGDTDTGDGITVMVRRLWTAGYLSLEEADGTYDADVANALAALQRDAGLTGPVGVMTPALWDALFDLDTTGYTLRGSRIEPAAQADNVRRYNRSASGAVIGKNAAYDPSKLIVDRPIDFGSGQARHQMRGWSDAEVDRGQDNWVGTITLNTGAVLAGDVAAGTTITAADLMDVRAIKPGMNGRIHFGGQALLMHVAVVDVDTQDGAVTTARLTVDTQARDALAVWEVIRRNKETRRDPARRWHGNRASGQVKDSITEWDEIGGVLSGDRELVAGWNRLRVVGATEGTIAWIKTNVVAAGTVNGVEYALAVFGDPVTRARLTAIVPDPLGTNGDIPWWEKHEELDRLNIRYASGTNRQACGYGRGDKTKGAELTGLHIDDTSFSYRCGEDNLLDVMVWVGEDATIAGGRIMRNQLEAGA